MSILTKEYCDFNSEDWNLTIDNKPNVEKKFIGVYFDWVPSSKDSYKQIVLEKVMIRRNENVYGNIYRSTWYSFSDSDEKIKENNAPTFWKAFKE